MATQLKLRNTTNNGITDTGDGTVYDMRTTFGASADTCVTNTTASGTQIQLTKTAGGSTVAWISGRAPAGGFTLTAADISVWQRESANAANCGGRFRIFKRTAAGVVTELAGGPFNDGVEMVTTDREDLWTANPTDTAFAENDRILIRLYLTNIGTMGGSRTCTHTFNAASAATGDSFFNIAETVAFKAEIVSGDGTSQGTTPSAAGVGRSTAAASSTTPGTSTVSATGTGIRFANGSAAGTVTVEGVGDSSSGTVNSGDGTSTGGSTVSAQGSSTAVAVASGAGTTLSVTAVGRAFAAAQANTSGAGVVSATGRSTASATASTTGIGTVTATGQSTAQAVGSAAGTVTVTGVAPGAESVGTALGAAVALAVGLAIKTAQGSTAGNASVTAAGLAFVAGTGTVSGVAVALGYSPSLLHVVAAASRTLAVPAEWRRRAVPAENRRLAVPAENRRRKVEG